MRYCAYRYAKAVHNGYTTYCPFIAPKDPPQLFQSPISDHDSLQLPLRNNQEIQFISRMIVDMNSTKLAIQHAINSESIFTRLQSIDMVRSFPPDEMHLWFDNIFPDLVQHLRGKFHTAPVASAESTKGDHEHQEENDEFAEDNDNAANDGNPAKQAATPTKKRKLNDGFTQLPELQQQPKTPKTCKRDMWRSTQFDPTKDRLNILMSSSEGCKWHFLKWLGPMWVYSQWGMERLCGMHVLWARNRFWANRNIEVNLLLQEWRNAIPVLDFQIHIPNNTTQEGDQHQPQSLGSPLAPAENDVGNDQDIERLIEEDDDENDHLWSRLTKMLAGKDITIAPEVSLDVITLARPAYGSKLTPQIRRCLSDYFDNVPIKVIMDTESPTRYMAWAGCIFADSMTALGRSNASSPWSTADRASALHICSAGVGREMANWYIEALQATPTW
ncbi:hypothetical protein BDD12DRAFT_806510 [Trichophaea hybrida]|nr:hypothetical protein BDD12DRAFT_806510 [Trichophaea hybrida]